MTRFSCFRVLAAVVSLAAFLGRCPARAQWAPTKGPYGGNITAFATLGPELFAATSTGAVYRSGNQGTSWRPASAGLPPFIIRDMTVSGNTIFVCNQRGIFRSLDTGRTWTVANGGLSGGSPNINMLSSVGSSTAVAASYFGNAVFVSRDRGLTWLSQGSGTLSQITDIVSGGGLIFAGTNGAGIYRSADTGKTWTPANSGIPLPANIKTLHATPTAIYATTTTHVYKSTNGGGSWIVLGNGISGSISSIVESGANLYAGTDNNYTGIYRSITGGATWTSMNSGLDCRLISAMIVSGTTVFAGSWGGVFSTPNTGGSWTAMDSGLNSNPMSALIASGNELYAGAIQGGVWHSTDSGSSWHAISTGLPVERGVAALARSGTTLYAGTGIGIYQSTSAGLSWTQINGGLGSIQEQNIYSITINGSDIILGTEGGIFMAPLAGGTWTKKSSGLSSLITKQVLVKGSELFAVTASGVFRSADNAVSWNAVNTGLPNTIVSQIATDGTNLFAGLQLSAGVWMSANDGATWTHISNGIPAPHRVVHSLVLDGGDLYAGVQGAGVYRSRDTGRSWARFGPGIDSSTVYRILPAGGLLYSLPSDGGVWVYGKVPVPGLHTGSASTPGFRLYPVPMTSDAVLEFDNPANRPGILTLFDVSGRQVRSQQFAGGSSVGISRNALPGGHYYFRLQLSGSPAVSGKLMME